MSRTPIENQADLRIGFVEYVAPDDIKVQLDLEAPEEIAANAGIPRQFPRINSYVIIPGEGGHIVCQVEWINIERSPFPKRKGYKDYGLIDLPFPIRKMKVVPIGILKSLFSEEFKFHRGVHSFPSIGSPVLIPTDKQLGSIIKSGSNRRVHIGKSVLTGNEKVKIDPDRLFGRHLAVLGNTGSGKSCTVAGLIQWSMEAAKNNEVSNPNARFVILDPNGEYAKVFGDKAKVLQVNGEDKNKLEVPLWLWNSQEWKAFTQAKPGAQLPLLKRSLRAMRNKNTEIEEDKKIKAKRYFGLILVSARSALNNGIPWSDNYGKLNGFYNLVKSWYESSLVIQKENDSLTTIDDLVGCLNNFINAEERTKKYPNLLSNLEEIKEMISKMESVFQELGGNEVDLIPKNEDTPIPFKGDLFLNYIEALAKETGNEQYLEFLIERIRTLLGDSRMNSIIGDETEKELDKWLENYLGDTKDEAVTIIDLSLVPSEITHIITSVISRIIFEALQRYRKLNSEILPTVLVMEEAHSFITRYSDLNESESSAICTKAFEKIAREGRKFGLGLVISSQRPSELSPTVLSQCNSFILHRISNSRDQDLVAKLLPDNFRGLLRELPSLPSQMAVLLGWASELPILMKVRDLPKEQRPQSEDPDFWDVWTRKNKNSDTVTREVNWKEISDDWQENQNNYDEENIEQSKIEDGSNEVDDNDYSSEDGSSEEDDLPF